MERKKKVLQITGAIHQLKENRDLGSTKDMETRSDTLNSVGVSTVTIGIPARQDKLCKAELQRIDLTDFTHVLFEHNRYPLSQAWLRKTAPDLKILVRAHNAEIIHCVEKAIAIAKQPFHDGRKKQLKKFIKTCLRVIKTIYLDVRTANCCDYLLSCSDYETKNYWSFLNKKSSTITIGTLANYNQSGKRDIPAFGSCQKVKVCMVGGSVQSEFNDISLAQYSLHLKEFPKQIFETFSFSHSGRYGPVGQFTLPHTRYISPNTSFTDLMNSYDVLIVCTSLGRGIKTKILDAMASGKPVILPNRLYSRLDTCLKNGCIPYDGTTRDLQEALKTVRQKYAEASFLSAESYQKYEKHYKTALVNLITGP
jgi:glycosyltransferase involved in cell wall biosynthesis